MTVLDLKPNDGPHDKTSNFKKQRPFTETSCHPTHVSDIRTFLGKPQIFQKPRRHFHTEAPQILDHAIKNIASATWCLGFMRPWSDIWPYTIGAPKGEWGRSPLPKRNFKKHRFCSNGDINGFMWLTLQTKSIAEIGWRLGKWNIENQNKHEWRFSLFRLVLIFPVT
jgi:hypothetical protein